MPKNLTLRLDTGSSQMHWRTPHWSSAPRHLSVQAKRESEIGKHKGVPVLKCTVLLQPRTIKMVNYLAILDIRKDYPPLSRLEDDAMGLNEKRQIKKLEDEIIPGVKAEVKEITGIDLEIEIQWNGMANDSGAITNIENTVRVLPKVFRDICIDDLGKDCVRKDVKKALFTNTKADEVTLQDGVVHIACEWTYSAWGDEGIRAGIEKAL